MTTKSKTPQMPLDHAQGCPALRLETTTHADLAITAVHCLDCAAHVAITEHGELLPAPGVTGGLASLGAGDMEVMMRRATAADVAGRGL